MRRSDEVASDLFSLLRPSSCECVKKEKKSSQMENQTHKKKHYWTSSSSHTLPTVSGLPGFFFSEREKKTAAWHQVWKSLLPNSILTFNSCSPSVCIWLLDTNKTKDASAGWRRFGYNNEFHLCFHLSPSARFTATGWWNTAATSVWMDVIVSLD